MKQNTPAVLGPVEPTVRQLAEQWAHLIGYGYAPGHYMSRCHRCEQVVAGMDKRAVTCLPCAKLRHAERVAAFSDWKDDDDVPTRHPSI